MKNLIYLISLIIFFSSCNSSSKYHEGIETYLKELSMGVVMENDFKEVKLLKEVKAKELLNELYKNLEFEVETPKDTVLSKLDELINSEYLEDKESWELRRERFFEVSSLSENDIAYYIVEATHEFKNPLLNNALMSVTRTYIIDNKYKVLGSINKEDYEEYEKINSGIFKYEIAIMTKRQSDRS